MTAQVVSFVMISSLGSTRRDLPKMVIFACAQALLFSTPCPMNHAIESFLERSADNIYPSEIHVYSLSLERSNTPRPVPWLRHIHGVRSKQRCHAQPTCARMSRHFFRMCEIARAHLFHCCLGYRIRIGDLHLPSDPIEQVRHIMKRW
jgi:hypothetical protein